MVGARVLHWNGTDLPDELRELPAGTYVVEAVDEAPVLSAEDEKGLAEALASLRAGDGRTAEQVQQRIDAILRRSQTMLGPVSAAFERSGIHLKPVHYWPGFTHIAWRAGNRACS